MLRERIIVAFRYNYNLLRDTCLTRWQIFTTNTWTLSLEKIRAYYLAALRTGHFYCATFHSTMPGKRDANAGSRGFVMPGFLGSADGKKRSRPEVEVEVEIEAMRAYSPTPLLSRHRRSLVSAISYLSTVYASCNKNTFHHRSRRSSKSVSTCVEKHAYSVYTHGRG